MTTVESGTYPVSLFDGEDANGVANIVGMLLGQNLENFPSRIKFARKIARPVSIISTDTDSACTIVFGTDEAVVYNDVVGKPAVTVIATVDQILDVSQLPMKAGGLIPVGFFTGRGMTVLGGNLEAQARREGSAHPHRDRAAHHCVGLGDRTMTSLSGRSRPASHASEDRTMQFELPYADDDVVQGGGTASGVEGHEHRQRVAPARPDPGLGVLPGPADLQPDRHPPTAWTRRWYPPATTTLRWTRSSSTRR